MYNSYTYLIMNAKEIKENRKLLEITQAQLAVRLGVSLKTVSNYEKGEVIPDSKKALLQSIFEKNEANDVKAFYYKIPEVESKIGQLSEIINETKKIIKIAEENSNLDLLEYHKTLLKLYQTRIKLIIEGSAIKIKEDSEDNF